MRLPNNVTQVVVLLMVSGADVSLRNEDDRLPLALLPDDEYTLLENNVRLGFDPFLLEHLHAS